MKTKIRDIFIELSTIEGKLNRFFPSRAFKNTANIIENCRSIGMSDNKLIIIDAFGNSIKLGNSSDSIVRDILTNGFSSRLFSSRALVATEDAESKAVDNLSNILGIGPVTASKIYKESGISTIEELISVKPEIDKPIPNTSVNFTSRMNTGIMIYSITKFRRINYSDATILVNKIITNINSLKLLDGLSNVELNITIAGSYRRHKSTVGDLDFIIVIPKDSNREIIHSLIRKVYDILLVEGDKKLSGIIENFQVDFRIIEQKEFGCHLLHATGSAEYNMKLRAYAKSIGLKLNEYCIENGSDTVYFDNEEDVLKYLGVKYTPPNLR